MTCRSAFALALTVGLVCGMSMQERPIDFLPFAGGVSLRRG